LFNWLDERLDLRKHWRELAEHPVPPHAQNPIYCLGGITFLCFVIMAITGIFLALYYQPTPEAAYRSVQFIMDEVPFGAVVRSIHHYTANLMVIFVILHMLRVFYTGSFKKPRELNWVVGVCLLMVVLGFGFTGYLLPWDQTALWATIVGTEVMAGIPLIGKPLMIMARGGLEVSGHTLTRFYVVHVMILPVTILLLMGVHFLIVRKQGISGKL